MIIYRHHVQHKLSTKTTVYLTSLTVALNLLIPLCISAEQHSPGIIYQNNFNFGTDSMTDPGDNPTGLISFNTNQISNYEIGNNIGIGVPSGSYSSPGTVLFSFNENKIRESGVVGYCFDISRDSVSEFSENGSVIPTTVTLNKGFDNYNSLNISDNKISGPLSESTGMIDAASATEYATDKIYHVQQVLDLDNKKIYTFVNGEPLTDNINGEEVIAARNLPNDFVFRNISVNLSMTAVFFDNFRIEDLSASNGTFNVTDITGGDDNKSVYVNFSEPICIDGCSKENFEITTRENKSIAVKEVLSDGCCRVKLFLADAIENDTLFVKVRNTESSVISTGIGARLADNQKTYTVIFGDTLIYDNDFNDISEYTRNIISLQDEDSNVQNTDSWVVEQDDNGNIRLKLKEENQLTTLNDGMYKNFAASFDIQPKKIESDGSTYETSVVFSGSDNSNAETSVTALSIIQKYIKITNKYKYLIMSGTGSGQRINYECGKTYHIDIAFNPQRNTIYLYVDGECISESRVGDMKFEKLVMNFGKNTDYLDNLKIYEFNGYTQAIKITDARPKSDTITIQTNEPLNPEEISAADFCVSENGTAAEISDILLKDNNTTVDITLAQPIGGGRNYTVTAKRGLKNFANMATENEPAATASVSRDVRVKELALSEDNGLITANLQNCESGRSTAVLVVCTYTDGSDVPDKILTDSTFDADTKSQIGYLEPNETGTLRIESDFDNADIIRAYLWENLVNCAPYCTPVRLKS